MVRKHGESVSKARVVLFLHSWQRVPLEGVKNGKKSTKVKERR
jgi:hypothetical protein